jgi:hypothetical protein
MSSFAGIILPPQLATNHPLLERPALRRSTQHLDQFLVIVDAFLFRDMFRHSAIIATKDLPRMLNTGRA